MKKLRENLGRAYLLSYLTVVSTLALTVVALLQHPNQYQFILDFWTKFITIFVVPLVGVKALEKIGTAWANRRNGRTLKPKEEGVEK